MVYDPETNEYLPMIPYIHGDSVTVTGEWNSTKTIVPGHTMTVQMPEDEISWMTDNDTVLLRMAVEFGNIGFNREPVEMKYAGCGKVVASRFAFRISCSVFRVQ